MLRMLTLDGGPGPMLHTLILQRLERGEFPGLLDHVDVFSGTSDGGLIALYLAKHLGEGRTSAQAIDGCIEFANVYCDAFAADTQLFSFASGQSPLTRGHAFAAALRNEFGDMTLGDLTKKVVIASFDTLDWAARIFRNFGDDLTRDGPLTLVDVALATSSLPMFTPIHGGQDNHGYLDGILCANNPAMSAVSLAAKDLVPPGVNPLEAMAVLSMGVIQTAEEAQMERTGGLLATLAMLFSHSRDVRFFFTENTLVGKIGYLRSAVQRQRSWSFHAVEGVGAARWGWLDVFLRRPTFFLDLMLHGHIGEVDRQCKRLLGDARYHRYEPQMNLMRDVMNYLFDRGRKTRNVMAWTAGRCFGEHPESAFSADEVHNIGETGSLVAWLKQSWVQPAPGSVTANSANSPSVDSAVIVPP